MAQIEFQYNGISTIIQCKEDQKISEIFNNFMFKSNINEKDLNYTYNGRVISENDKNLKFNEIANLIDKKRTRDKNETRRKRSTFLNLPKFRQQRL